MADFRFVQSIVTTKRPYPYSTTVLALILLLVGLLASGCATAVPATSVPATPVPTTPVPAATTQTWATATPPLEPSPSPTPIPPKISTIPATATATVTASPTSPATATVEPSATPPPTRTTPEQGVTVRQDTIVLNTYGWQEALVDTAPGDVVYPYPRLEQSRVKPPEPRTYDTIVLENAYARLTLLPELGGRLLRWLDKTSGQELFYVNPVVKPTQWGARGWWLATGGMEWAFPVEEHGLIEWRPWQVRIEGDGQQSSVILSDQDDRTGLAIEIMVTLQADRSWLLIRPRISNPTPNEQSYQFWMNGMFALSPGNHPSPDLRLILPADSVTVHSSGDPGVPKENEPMSWPIHDGRDMSRYGNWKGWLGVFAHQISYMGAYDPASEMGVVRTFPDTALGAKIFGPGTLSPGYWTDDDSGYVELWGGLTPTFWDYTTLAAGDSIEWQERWYSVNGLGGVSFASDDAALWLEQIESDLQIGALATSPLNGQLALFRDGQAVKTWDVALVPGHAFRTSHPTDTGSPWELQLLDDQGQLIASCIQSD